MEDIFAEAKSQPDHALALQVLGQRYEAATEAVRKTLLADPRAKNIVATVANDVNKVFAAEAKNSIRAAGLAIRSVVKILTTYDLKLTMAGALLDETFKGHVQAFSAVQNGASDPAAPEFAREGQELMAQLLAFTAKVPQGKKAAARLTAFSENETNRLVSALRASLPPRAKTGFEHLVKIFTNLEPQTRFALLSQIDNYRNDKRIDQVIKNFELLCGGSQSGRRSPLAELFRKSFLFDQQRFAKVIAFVAQYPDGDRVILDNTLKIILDPNSNIEINWVNLGRDFGVRQRNLIALNSDYIEPGNNKLAGDNALHVAVNTLAHDVNHIKNQSPADGSAHHTEHEYVSWCVGFRARHGRWPNQFEAHFNCLHQLIWHQGIYKNISRTFHNKTAESGKIAIFIGESIGAKLLGKNPSEVTVQDIVRFDQTFVQMLKDNITFLSTTEEALIPQAIDGVPLNLDNHP